MGGQPDLAGLPARAEPDGVLDPSGWLCQSQGVSRPQAIRPGLGTWQELLAVEGQSLAATEEGDPFQPHCLRSSTRASQGP